MLAKLIRLLDGLFYGAAQVVASRPLPSRPLHRKQVVKYPARVAKSPADLPS